MGRVLPVVASRMISGLVATIISSGGCAQLAGIDNTSNDALADSVALKRMSIGASVTTAPLDLTGLSAKYYPDPGAAPVLATTTAAGTWTAKLPLPAPVELTLPPGLPPLAEPRLEPTLTPVGEPQLLAFPTPALQVLYPVLEHADPKPAPDGAKITLTVPLELATTGGELFRVFTIGSWTTRQFTDAEVPAVASMELGPVSYDFATSNVESGRSQLDALTAADAFLVLRYVGSALTGVAEAMLTHDQLVEEQVTTGTMVSVAADQTFAASIDAAAVAARYATAKPAVNTLGMIWKLTAAPGYLVGADTGPVLQFGPLTIDEPTMSVMYANPFASRSWNTLFTLVTSESRPFTPAGAMASVTLFASMQQRFEPIANATEPVALDLPAALPTRISLDAIQLTADGQTVAQPKQPAVVTFTADNPNATLFGLEVSELVEIPIGDAVDATLIERHIIYAAAASEPAFTLRPGIFQVGKNYVLRASVTYGGFPNIATGDLVTRSLPVAQAFLDSAVFTVTP